MSPAPPESQGLDSPWQAGFTAAGWGACYLFEITPTSLTKLWENPDSRCGAQIHPFNIKLCRSPLGTTW